ncbi:MAG: hypothetical protein ABH986_04325 [archaeon]
MAAPKRNLRGLPRFSSVKLKTRRIAIHSRNPEGKIVRAKTVMFDFPKAYVREITDKKLILSIYKLMKVKLALKKAVKQAKSRMKKISERSEQDKETALKAYRDALLQAQEKLGITGDAKLKSQAPEKLPRIAKNEGNVYQQRVDAAQKRLEKPEVTKMSERIRGSEERKNLETVVLRLQGKRAVAFTVNEKNLASLAIRKIILIDNPLARIGTILRALKKEGLSEFGEDYIKNEIKMMQKQRLLSVAQIERLLGK